LYPNTRIAQHPIGALAYSQVIPKVDRLGLLPPSFTLKQAAGKTVVTPKEMGLQLDTARIAASASHRAWLPLQNLFVAHTIPVYTKINRAVLVQKLTALSLSSKQQPTNAQIVIRNSQFALAGEIRGSQLNIAQAESAVTKAVASGQTVIDLPMADIAPAVTAASLQAGLHQLQAQQAVSLAYTYNGQTAKPSAATIAGWYVQVGSSYSLQLAKIQSYISQVGSTYGFRVQNLAAAAAATQQSIQAVKPLTFALTAVPPGVCSNNTGSQLVVVSIGQQHMWACDGYNQVYDTAITSGAYLAGTPTPTGTWHIYAKQTNVVLRGPTWSDPVSYWLPFYSDYGFHDSSWQTFPYGDPAYAADGSHGCVHLPLAAMAWLYGWAHIGTTVTITT
ncbi:MAG TPA: L,D-transpeptidase family protein, partial [Candidatus Saccharimonadales bacterium]